MKVLVEEYNPAWASQFEEVKKGLEKVLDGLSFIRIEHIGSTSVPGLAAKPILDIDIVAQPSNLAALKTALLEVGGYEYMGEWGIPDRHAFRHPSATPRRNLYVCMEGSQALRNHLLVRDICRKDVSVREAYSRKKLELAKKDWENMIEYTEAKNQILQYVLERAGMGQDELLQIQQHNTVGTQHR